MGMIYRKKYKKPDGSVFEGRVWWIKYYRSGRPFRESSGSTKETVAKQLLKLREGDIVRGVPVTPRANRCTVDELLADVVTDYQMRGLRSEDALRRRIKHLKPYFGGWRAVNVTTAKVREYIVARQKAGASNSQINRELAALKRAFSLGIDANKVTARPKITTLEENNARTGFFEREQFEAVRAKLSAPLQHLVTAAYITGWRVKSELQRLQWRHVDFDGGIVHLDPEMSKNKNGRVFPFTAELRALLETQRTYTNRIQRERGTVIPWVFHRKGAPIRYFYQSWATACRKAGCPGRIPHDFRRSAVRNLVRAGISERVAMTMTGHKTRCVFERYNIVSPGDLTEAARKLDEVAGTIAGTTGTDKAASG